MKPIRPEDIDAILPQTQCGLCGYAGCLPYARALITENAPPHLCPPGGIETLKEIGNLLRQDVSPYLASMLETEKKPAAAIIREQECIGCTKCIQVCPVDAIIGSAKNMHSIIRDECTGCELCVPACPVDCIDLENLGVLSKQQQQQKRITARMRFQARNKRLENAKRTELKEKNVSDDRKKYISDAIARTKAKKNIV